MSGLTPNQIFEMNKLIWLLIVLFLSHEVIASKSPDHTSQYVGEENREIKALSAADIVELQKGGGWGFAKPAELNGVPGPAHLLEMKEEISLNPEQVFQIEKIYEEMRSEAIPLGNEYIDAERNLDTLFKTGSMSSDSVLLLIEQIEDIRAKLRYVHLSRHLETVELLSEKQIKRYNKLRGYSEGSVCDNIPEGHDAEMFKKHNGCE